MNQPQGGRSFPNLVIRASAGTGKTFRLSNRFLGLLRADIPCDQILATTFTRKAAGEIMDRVISRLGEAASDEDKLSELATFIEDPALDRDACLEMLEATMRSLHRLRVSTLDSFFSQIARSHALELGLPSAWQIVDELFDGRLRRQAIDAVLGGGDSQRLRTLVFLLTKGEANRSISRVIRETVDGLYNLFVQTNRKAWEAVPQYKPLDKDQLTETLDELQGVELSDRRLERARNEDCDRALQDDWEGFLAKGLAAKVAAGQFEFYRKPIPEPAVACYERLIKHVRAVLVGRLAQQTRATCDLLELFDAEYRRLKDSHGVLRFEDVTRRLGDGHKAFDQQALAFRLDSQIDHLLLDEFQDTSPQQWRVLRALAQRVTADPQQSFFCVGDVKQSIYGWRGGVPEIFDALDQQLTDLDQEALNVSYRSSQAVIDSVNRIFFGLDQHPNLNRAEPAVRAWRKRFQKHETAKQGLAGYVELCVATRVDEAGQQRDETLQFAAGKIQEIVEQAPGASVGVLVRKNETVAKLIFELRKLNVLASEEGGNPLTDSAAVLIVISLLRLADHPGDTVARFHVAHSPLGPLVDLTDHRDDQAARRLAQRIRQAILVDGYGPTMHRWASQLAEHCNRRELNRLEQLVEMAYAYESNATLRTDDFVAYVEATRVADPIAADVRVMTVHQSKGLQFDVVVLPELSTNLVGHPDPVVIDRPEPAGPVERVCRYASADVRQLLPPAFQQMFDEATNRSVTEALCVLYVAVTRAVHALHMIIPPSSENERSLPCTFAGLLRVTLRDARPAEPGAILFHHGDPKWHLCSVSREVCEEPDSAAETSSEPISVHLAPVDPASGRRRGWERARPSGLEGGTRVDVRQILTSSRSSAFLQGQLIHAWFEQIEWLEDGRPTEHVLRRVWDQIMAGGESPTLSFPEQSARFQEMLDRSAIAGLLNRQRYERIETVGFASDVCHALKGDPLTLKVQNERGFAIRQRGQLLNGFIDRLVLLESQGRIVAAEIIDFKTDAFNASDAKQLSAKVEFYGPQLDAYRRSVAKLTGLPTDRIAATLSFVSVGLNSPVSQNILSSPCKPGQS